MTILKAIPIVFQELAYPSCSRRRVSTNLLDFFTHKNNEKINSWIPAFAGMTQVFLSQILKHKRSITLLLILALGFALPQIGYANEQGFGVQAVTAYPAAAGVSRIGKVTGQACRNDEDCIVGCVSGQPDDMKCLTLDEASNECVDPDKAPDAEYPCGCLSDTKRCGFLFMSNKAQQDDTHMMSSTQTTPVKKHAKKVKKASTKKTMHKKPVRKATHKKKTVKSVPAVSTAAPAPTPTPLSEPAHDSRQ